MNYLKIYNDLVESRKELRGCDKKDFHEIHHIVPKCLGGSDDNNNLVTLTFREHYIVHWLLIKIYPKNVKINYAFLCMIRDPHGYRRLTSKMVETIKRNYAEFKKWHIKMINPGKSKKSRETSKKRMLSEENPMKKYPEKNHTAKKTTVYYNDGTVIEYKTKKDFLSTLHGLTYSQKRNITNNSDLSSFNIKKIIIKDKENIPAKSCIGRKWYNNGEINEFVFEGEQSDGFILGMIKNKRGTL